jgi:AcrR family transcriptional regulator
MAVAAKRDTKTAILDAAQKLMAEHGTNGVSLRAILNEAGANPAALHYHFGSRESLIEAILARHGRRNSERRRTIIEKMLARETTAEIHDVVDALVDPILQMLVEEGESGRRFVQFLARLQSDRTGIHLELEAQNFADIHKGIRQMYAEACPHVPKKIESLRITMAIDSMLQSLANADVMSNDWTEEHPGKGLIEFANSLKDFLAGGLSADVR